MALTESEELELLELENEEAGAMRDTVAQPTQPSLFSRAAGFLAEEGTPAAGAMLGAAASLPYSPLAGPLAPLVPVAGAAIGAR